MHFSACYTFHRRAAVRKRGKRGEFGKRRWIRRKRFTCKAAIKLRPGEASRSSGPTACFSLCGAKLPPPSGEPEAIEHRDCSADLHSQCMRRFEASHPSRERRPGCPRAAAKAASQRIRLPPSAASDRAWMVTATAFPQCRTSLTCLLAAPSPIVEPGSTTQRVAHGCVVKRLQQSRSMQNENQRPGCE
jgi:hypothetical protein